MPLEPNFLTYLHVLNFPSFHFLSTPFTPYSFHCNVVSSPTNSTETSFPYVSHVIFIPFFCLTFSTPHFSEKYLPSFLTIIQDSLVFLLSFQTFHFSLFCRLFYSVLKACASQGSAPGCLHFSLYTLHLAILFPNESQIDIPRYSLCSKHIYPRAPLRKDRTKLIIKYHPHSSFFFPSTKSSDITI